MFFDFFSFIFFFVSINIQRTYRHFVEDPCCLTSHRKCILRWRWNAKSYIELYDCTNRFFSFVHRCADAIDRFEIVDFLTRFQVSQVHQFQINTRSTMSFKIVIICEWLDKKKNITSDNRIIDKWEGSCGLRIVNYTGVQILLRKCKSFQIQRHHHWSNMAMKIISKVYKSISLEIERNIRCEFYANQINDIIFFRLFSDIQPDNVGSGIALVGRYLFHLVHFGKI